MFKIFPKYLNFKNISKKYIRVSGPLEILTEIPIGAVFREIQCFSRTIRPEVFLKKRLKF